jgi:UDP-N-acetylmuramoyl-tripeptide--D-alanyl-D-alanine ligase
MKRVLRPLLIALLWSGASRKLRREKPYLILISGSVGKTSAKDAIADVLARSDRPVLKTLGNMNTEVGTPLSLLGFNELPDGILEWISAMVLTLFPPRIAGKGRPFYVIEVAADRPGDIRFLTDRLGPCDVAVMTPIVAQHIANYASIEELAKEESSILQAVKPEGYALLQSENAPLAAYAGVVSPTLWYGLDGAGGKTGVQGKVTGRTSSGLVCQMEYRVARSLDSVGGKRSQRIEVRTRVMGEHQLYALLVAAAIGFQEGLSADRIKEGLEAYEVPSGRGRIIEGQKGITIVDDTYNGAPDGVKAGLAMLREFAGDRRVVAILGNMNELGDFSEQAHKEVAAAAGALVDFLVVVGPHREIMAKAAHAAGMPKVSLLSFATPEQLISHSSQCVQADDVVYVKGSQNNVRLERFVKKIMAHPEQAGSLLVRQGRSWSH